jgi:protein-S-isoprenylcysteine O-methyltransferase Ste14
MNRYSALLLAIASVWVTSEIVIARLRRSDPSSSTGHDRRSLQILQLATMIGPFLGAVLVNVRAAMMPAAIRPYAYWGGLALIVIGMAIRWTAIGTLKRYFTVDVAIAKDHKVIDHGLYAIVRHPSYSGSLLSFIGLGFAFLNWLSLAVCVACATAGFAYRIAVEERALIEALGDDYRSYAARTKRLIPGLF